MTKGAIYNIIARSEDDDALVNAMDILKDRLIRKMLENGAQIANFIYKNKKSDLMDFKKTDTYNFLLPSQEKIPSISYLDHAVSIFLNYSYKPFALVAQEYDVIQSAAPRWNNEIRFTLNQYGQFISDCVVHIRLKGLRAKDPRDRVRYINMPGARIFEKVQFQIDRVVIDEYNFETYNQFFYREVISDDKKAWERMMGQQDEYEVLYTPDPLNDLFSTKRVYTNGAQTFKQEQDVLDLWVPMLFWFKNYKNALPHRGLNWGQIDIVVTLTNPDNLISYANFGGGGQFDIPQIETCELYANNIYTDPLVYSLLLMKIKLFKIDTHRQMTLTLTEPEGRIRLFDKIKWPISRLSVSFRPVANESLSEYWYYNSVLTPNHIFEPVLAKSASTVINGGFISATPVSGVLSGGLSSLDGFYNGYYFNITGGTGYNTNNIELNRYYVLNYIGATNTVIPNQPWRTIPDTTTTYELYLPQIQAGQVQFYTESPPVDTIEVTLNTIPYINQSEIMLHDTYTPYKTKGIVAPRSPGNVEIFFELENHERDLKGHYPFKDGQSYLNYTSSYVNSDTPVTAYITGHAINFFYLNSNGHAKLLYP